MREYRVCDLGVRAVVRSPHPIVTLGHMHGTPPDPPLVPTDNCRPLAEGRLWSPSRRILYFLQEGVPLRPHIPVEGPRPGEVQVGWAPSLPVLL